MRRCLPFGLPLLACLLSLAVGPVHAQSEKTATADIRATLNRLFDGMRAGDSTMVRSTFAEGATLRTVLASGDSSVVRTTPLRAFLDAVGRPHEAVWDERIWDVEVRLDGPMAAAWVPYAFYRGDSLSHCGVNAVQLVRHSERWKILHLTDTRTPAVACTVPDAVAGP